jgi:hypothetical protein
MKYLILILAISTSSFAQSSDEYEEYNAQLMQGYMEYEDEPIPEAPVIPEYPLEEEYYSDAVSDDWKDFMDDYIDLPDFEIPLGEIDGNETVLTDEDVEIGLDMLGCFFEPGILDGITQDQVDCATNAANSCSGEEDFLGCMASESSNCGAAIPEPLKDCLIDTFLEDINELEIEEEEELLNQCEEAEANGEPMSDECADYFYDNFYDFEDYEDEFNYEGDEYDTNGNLK